MVRLIIACSAACLIAALVFSGSLAPQPSPYYMIDTINYKAPGPEFKLSREAAAQKAYKADEAARIGEARNY